MQRYVAIQLPRGWGIADKGVRLPDFLSDECSAKSYAVLWNYWNGPYNRNEPERCKPLTQEVRLKMLAIALGFMADTEDEEGQPVEQPTQMSLW